MSENFKILIAYDGSKCANAALDDLKVAGLPDKDVDATVISVAEVWLPPQDEENGEEYKFLNESLRRKYEEKMAIFGETKKLVAEAADRIRLIFPNWNVQTEATYGSPAWEILAFANELKADLIIVGAKGLTALEKILVGSISQKVVTEANCAVRVARGKVEVDEALTRIIIGYDGTDGSKEIIKKISERSWKSDAEFKIIIVEDAEFVSSSLEIDVEEIEKIGNDLVETLKDQGLNTSIVITEGNPKEVLIEEADRWDADCIFIGATKFNDFLTKYLLGSVASAVVSRANCSVEVVRPKSYQA